MVELLLSYEISLTQKNKYGLNVFHVVSENENLTILKLIINSMVVKKLKAENINDYLEATTIERCYTPLHLAAKKGSNSIAEYLISNLNINKEVLDYKGRTPLALAAQYSKEEYSFILS